MKFQGYLANVKDAFILAEASSRNLVEHITVRPSFSQRYQIVPGTTIIFNERNTNMKRWSDGRAWSVSKFHDGYFVYKQIPDKGKISKRSRHNDKGILLFKKAISVLAPNGDTIHIINYYTQEMLNLKNTEETTTPSNFPFLGSESIKEAAKEYRYFKSFRSSSKSFKKPFKAPESEFELDLIPKGLPSSNTPQILNSCNMSPMLNLPLLPSKSLKLDNAILSAGVFDIANLTTNSNFGDGYAPRNGLDSLQLKALNQFLIL